MHLLLRVAVVAAVLTSAGCLPDNSKPQAAETTTTSNQPGDRQRTGALAEGARMAEALVLPAEVDPALVRPGESGVLTRAMLLVSVGHNPVIRDAATKNGLVTGFITSGSDASGGSSEKVLTQGIMRFPDSSAAIRAAEDLGDAALSSRGMLETDARRAVSIPGSPGIRFSLYSMHNTSNGTDRVDSMAFTPHAEYVIFTRVSARSDEQAAAATIRATELQRPLLDSFAPTDDAKLADLTADPEGMFALSVGKGSAESGSYGPRGAALFAFDQLVALKVFQDTGMTAAGVRGTYVYRTRDPEAAKRLGQALADSAIRLRKIRDAGLVPAANPPDAGAARCWSITDGGNNSWHCVVPEGRYVGEIWARDATEAHDLTTKQQRAFAAAR